MVSAEGIEPRHHRQRCPHPEGAVIGFNPDEDAKNCIVTETGITVVTRDYSLFEGPVAVDYFVRVEGKQRLAKGPRLHF